MSESVLYVYDTYVQGWRGVRPASVAGASLCRFVGFDIFQILPVRRHRVYRGFRRFGALPVLTACNDTFAQQKVLRRASLSFRYRSVVALANLI